MISTSLDPLKKKKVFVHSNCIYLSPLVDRHGGLVVKASAA